MRGGKKCGGGSWLCVRIGEAGTRPQHIIRNRPCERKSNGERTMRFCADDHKGYETAAPGTMTQRRRSRDDEIQRGGKEAGVMRHVDGLHPPSMGVGSLPGGKPM